MVPACDTESRTSRYTMCSAPTHSERQTRGGAQAGMHGKERAEGLARQRAGQRSKGTGARTRVPTSVCAASEEEASCNSFLTCLSSSSSATWGVTQDTGVVSSSRAPPSPCTPPLPCPHLAPLGTGGHGVDALTCPHAHDEHGQM